MDFAINWSKQIVWDLTQWIRLIFNEKQLRSTLAIILSIIQLNTCNIKSKKDRERERTLVFIVVHPFSSLLRATSTLLDEVHLHQGHPLCNKCWLQCLQELLQIKALIIQLLCKTLLQTLSTPWIWCFLNLRILELPVHSFELFTWVFNATSGKRTPFWWVNN